MWILSKLAVLYSILLTVGIAISTVDCFKSPIQFASFRGGSPWISRAADSLRALLTDRFVLRPPPSKSKSAQTAPLTAASYAYNISIIEMLLDKQRRLTVHLFEFLYDDARDSGDSDSDRRDAILYFHGAREDIRSQLGKYQRMARMFALPILVMEYPGYAEHRSPPSSRLIVQAAEETLRHILNDGYRKRIILFGSGFGTKIALYLASSFDRTTESGCPLITGLILKNPVLPAVLIRRRPIWGRLQSFVTKSITNINTVMLDSSIRIFIWDTKVSARTEEIYYEQFARKWKAQLLLGPDINGYHLLRFVELCLPKVENVELEIGDNSDTPTEEGPIGKVAPDEEYFQSDKIRETDSSYDAATDLEQESSNQQEVIGLSLPVQSGGQSSPKVKSSVNVVYNLQENSRPLPISSLSASLRRLTDAQPIHQDSDTETDFSSRSKYQESREIFTDKKESDGDNTSSSNNDQPRSIPKPVENIPETSTPVPVPVPYSFHDIPRPSYVSRLPHASSSVSSIQASTTSRHSSSRGGRPVVDISPNLVDEMFWYGSAPHQQFMVGEVATASEPLVTESIQQAPIEIRAGDFEKGSGGLIFEEDDENNEVSSTATSVTEGKRRNWLSKLKRGISARLPNVRKQRQTYTAERQ